MIVDSASILSSTIVALTIEGGGVCALEKDVQQLLVGYFVGVVAQLNGFGVAGRSRANCFVARVLNLALGVADVGASDSWNALIGKLNAPETATSKSG